MENQTEAEVSTEEVKPVPRKRKSRESDPRAKSSRARVMGADGDRVPIGGHSTKLNLTDYGDQLKGYQARWFNDSGSRIQDALKGGWQPIYPDGSLDQGDGSYEIDRGTWLSMQVGTTDNGQAINAYALKIKEEWYTEDQKRKADVVNQVDNEIKRRGVDQPAGDNHYVKSINYDVGSRK